MFVVHLLSSVPSVLAMRSANLLINCLHSFDTPPDVRNTAGVNVASSTFNTLSRYSSFSWRVTSLVVL